MDKRPEAQSLNDDNLTRIYKKFRGGHVVRYHTRPEIMDGQNVAAHTWRAMVVLHTLWPDASKNCLLYMMYHDVAEAETGDVPATTKWKYPELAQLMQQVESSYEETLGVGGSAFNLTEAEKHYCDIADKLELVFHCFRLMQQGNSLARGVYLKGVEYLKDNYSSKDYFAPVQEVISALGESLSTKNEITLNAMS